jgi:hypothetical protein
MMASKSEEIRKEQEIAASARPLILERLQAGDEPLAISRLVSERFGVDEQLSYRWSQYIGEDYARQKRLYVAIGLVVLWIGVLVAATGTVLSVLGIEPFSFPLWAISLIAGVPLLAVGIGVLLMAGRLVKLSV